MNFIKKLVGAPVSRNSASGDIVLGYGQHELTIEMDKTPCQVQLSMKSPCDATPVCHADVNKVGVTILDNGFILYADIQTNTCCVTWTCEVM